jgi:hypothetical protein
MVVWTVPIADVVEPSKERSGSDDGVTLRPSWRVMVTVIVDTSAYVSMAAWTVVEAIVIGVVGLVGPCSTLLKDEMMG